MQSPKKIQTYVVIDIRVVCVFPYSSERDLIT